MVILRPPKFFTYSLGNKFFVGLIILFFIIITGVIVVVYGKAQQARQLIQQSQFQSFNQEQEVNKEEVSRITLQRGNGEWVEILRNGQINQYDANGNLIKSGLLGYYQVNRLFSLLGRNLHDYALDYLGLGDYVLTVYTNKGTTTINVTGGGGGGGLDDIIEEIEELEENTLNPTPSPTPQPTQPGSQPTSPPGASVTPVFSPTPLPTPTVGPGTPTPLPAYMTADPFTCEDYAAQLSRPFPISNILCGLDPNSIQ